MPRRTTELHLGEFYHVYNRGANRSPIFFTRENYLFFLQRLREKVACDTATIVCWCLLLNHYHLLVHIESDQFSSAMQAFGTSYSKAINKQQDRTGTLFEGRFQAKHVDEENYLRYLSRYIHLNPSAAKLAASPASWEFSSYPDYIGERSGTLATKDIILQEFQSVLRYREFV